MPHWSEYQMQVANDNIGLVIAAASIGGAAVVLLYRAFKRMGPLRDLPRNPRM